LNEQNFKTCNKSEIQADIIKLVTLKSSESEQIE